jgi:hypothetical protein
MNGTSSLHYTLPPVASDPFTPTNSNYPLSPTTSIASGWSRRESVGSRASDEVDRRRTWHPDTLQLYHRESRLSQVITPSQIAIPAPEIAVRSETNPDQPQQQTTLPSVQSLLRDVDSNMANHAATSAETNGMMGDSRRNSGLPSEWDRSLHRRVEDLNISNSPRDGAGTWANETNQAVLAQAERAHVIQQRGPPPTVRFNPEVESAYGSTGSRSTMGHHHTMSAPTMTRKLDNRRQGWYNGPVPRRASPPDTIHEGRAHVERLEHPNFRQFSGFPAPRDNPPVVHQHPGHPPMASSLELHGTDNSPLDVLVAAASSLETANPSTYRTNSTQQDQIMRDSADQQRIPPPFYPAPSQFAQAQPMPRCNFCGVRNTSEWRDGPDGPGTLCNSCGLQYLESRRQADRRFGPPRLEQYVGQQV